MTPDPFELAARRFERSGAAPYYNDPVGFAKKMILWPADQELTSYQQEILGRIPKDQRLAVRGPHGLGKTGIKAIAVLWFALTREACQVDWKCITTAGAWRQLEKYLWPEIHKWIGRLDWARLGIAPWRKDRELLDLSIKLRYGAAFAVASSHKELIEGAHADSIFYIFDEGKSIKPDIYDAAEGAFSGTGQALAVVSSTPGPESGRFFDIHARKPGLDDWTVRHVKVWEAIAAGRISRDWVIQRAKQWGGCPKLVQRSHRCDQSCPPNSTLYANRALGEFHSSDDDVVIPLAWAEAATERWLDWEASGRPSYPGRQVSGVDVARGGSAKTVVADRTGPIVTKFTEHQVADTVLIARKVMFEHMLHMTDLCTVDVIGVGAGVVDTIRHTPHKQVIAFNAARATKLRDRSGQLGFVNQRAAMWWRMREMLDPAFEPALAFPPIDELLGELVAPKWWVTAAGKIAVESKDEVAERIGRSTNYADALGQCLLTESEFNDVQSGPIHFPYSDQPNEMAFAWEGSKWDE